MALAYLLALLTSAVGMVVALWARSTGIAVLVILSKDLTTGRFDRSLQIRGLDMWSVLLVGIIWVILMVFTEEYYRVGLKRGLLLARFCLITAIEAGVFFVSHAIYFIIGKQAGVLDWGAIATPAIGFFATILFAWLYDKLVKRPVRT